MSDNRLISFLHDAVWVCTVGPVCPLHAEDARASDPVLNEVILRLGEARTARDRTKLEIAQATVDFLYTTRKQARFSAPFN
jgi:hypothetical protein